MSINIHTKNMRFAYGGKDILKNINFAIDGGETWAFIGRNGAGKSTLLKCLCGLLTPSKKNAHVSLDDGVFINGRDIKNIVPKEIAKIITYVPQGYGRQAPPFTVREYVSMARHPYQTFMAGENNDDRAIINAALEITDATNLADRAMTTLSGGELQLALIAGAVAQETPFLFLDEPTTHLDPYHQEKIRTALSRIRIERNTAIITVTHDINFALSAHDNILALVDGRVFFCGSKENFCENAIENLCNIFSVKFTFVNVPNNHCANRLYFATGETR